MPSAILDAILKLDGSHFEKGLNNASAQAEKVAKTMQGAIVGAAIKIGAALATAFAFEKIEEMSKSVIDLGAHLQETSFRTGINVKSLAILQESFKRAGLDADKVGQSVNRLQKAIFEASHGTGEAGAVFTRLGINLKYLQTLSPEKQFELIGQKLRSIPDPAERAADAMKLFGKSGGELLQLFNDPSIIGGATGALGKQADLLQKNAAKFKEVSDLLQTAGTKIQGFFVGAASEIVDSVLPLLKSLEDLDLTSKGEAFVRLFKDPKNFEGFLDAMQKFLDSGQILKFVGGLEKIFIGLAALFGAVLVKALMPVFNFMRDALQYVFSNAADIMVTAFLNAIVSIAMAGVKILDAAFGTHLSEKLGKSVQSGIANVVGATVGKGQSFEQIQKANAGKDVFSVNTGVETAFDLIKGGAKDIGGSLSQAYGQSFGQMTPTATGGAPTLPGLLPQAVPGAPGQNIPGLPQPTSPEGAGGAGQGQGEAGQPTPAKLFETFNLMAKYLASIDNKVGAAIVG
jgi:hypothetical protein